MLVASPLRLVPPLAEPADEPAPPTPATDADVVVLPCVPTLSQRQARPVLARVSRFQVVLWPVLGATLTALGMMALRTESTAPEDPVVAPAVQRPARSESAPAAPPPLAPEPLPKPAPAVTAAPPAPAAAVPPAPTPQTAALANARVSTTQTHLVYQAPARPRDWYAAMDLCRRSHAGLDGWTTPTSRELHTLAKARALPPASLWSRTRAAQSADVAFAVHGRAGRTQGTPKDAKLDAAVCIRKRTDAPDPG